MKKLVKVCILAGLLSSFAVADDHGNSIASATNISATSSTPGVIERGDNDYFRFRLSTSRTVVISTDSSIDTYGYLLDSSGNVISSNDDSSSSLNFSIRRTLDAGTYYVRVRGYSNSTTGRYNLRVNYVGGGIPTPLSDDHGNSISSATNININSTTVGNIDRSRDNDYFRIRLTQSGTLNLSTSGTTDTFGYLLNSNGRIITSNDDGGVGNNFSISRLMSAGTYYVRIRGYSNSTTGRYVLRSSFSRGTNPRPSPAPNSDDHGDSVSSATAINANSTTHGRLERVGDNDFFRIILERIGILELSTSGSIDTYGYLLNSNGSTIERDDDSGSGMNFKIQKSLSPGTYFVKVKGYSNSVTGSYILRSTITYGSTTTFPSASAVNNFIARHHGRGVDVDGLYGYQCVDLMHSYIGEVLGVPRSSHNIRGNAYPIYRSLGRSTIISNGTRRIRLDKIDNTPSGVPQKGDIIFFRHRNGIGHVAIFIDGNENSFRSLDQNWFNANSTRGSVASYVTHRYTGAYSVVGWLRPVLLSR